MERETLESAAPNYGALQGLFLVPTGLLGLITALAVLVGPPELVMHAIAGGGLLLCVVACLRIARHYRDTYGTVTLSASRQVRSSVGGVLAVVILLLGGIQAGPLYVWPWSAEDAAVSTFTAAVALAALVLYAVAVALRTHHVVIWGSVLAISLLPIWGGLGPDDRWGAAPWLGVAVATIASGLLDHRLLVRGFRSPPRLKLEHGHVGG
jgi:hypothetical protein